MDIFLSNNEKKRLARWKYHVEDNSITTEYLNPFYNYLSSWVPNNVAPNVISLTGLLCTLYAFYLSYNYFTIWPRLMSLFFAVLTFTYMCLDAIDGKQARRIHNSTPLGELFDHSCDNVGVVFLMLNMCYILGITDMITQWYIIQLSQFVFLGSHIEAFKDRIVKFGRYSGPGEVLCAFIGIALLRIIIPFNFNDIMNNYKLAELIYYFVIGYVLYEIVNIGNYETRIGLMMTVLIACIPNFLIRMQMINVDIMTIVGNAIILSIVSGDMIVSKMANKELHALIPVFVMMSLFNNYLSIVLVCAYYVIVLSEIAYFMNIPVFNVMHNVYCNGVYDLCHVGHMNLFETASSYGTRLIVGVHGDGDVISYKREPVMSHNERCDIVSKCRFVSEVIPCAPLIITEDFIKKYNIHTVVCSVEYDSPDDKYYAIPRKMGILKVLPRTSGISTSGLISRLKNRESEVRFGC